MKKTTLAQQNKSSLNEVIKIAIMAVGGQGGGVLSNWIVDLAEKNGYYVQATSVAGVAQRTGATIYYLELFPRGPERPVFSLHPSQGDVDILIASELMEAGRAVMRGFVTPDRTVVIASTHRTLAVPEKIAPGNEIGNSNIVLEAVPKVSRRFISFDMEEIATESGTVISACLFGALAGSEELPFGDSSFEEVINASGRGVEASLKAFKKSLALAKSNPPLASSDQLQENNNPTPKPRLSGPLHLLKDFDQLKLRLDNMPEPVRDIGLHGLCKVVEFQDIQYGVEYIDRVDDILKLDKAHDGENHQFAFTVTAAKYIANAMSYDDLIRIADVKTRGNRIERIEDEVALEADNVLRLTEYFHPRATEVCGLMPVKLGKYVEARPKLFNWLDRRINRGRRVRTDKFGWFFILYMVAGLRWLRRGSLRHQMEMAQISNWLVKAIESFETDYDLGVEVLNAYRLIKGYGDTHQRGKSKFHKVLDGIKLVMGREDSADWAHRLQTAALAEEGHDKLDGAIKTIRSFTEETTG